MGQTASEELDPEFIKRGKDQYLDMIRCDAARVCKHIIDGREVLDALCTQFLLVDQFALEARRRLVDVLKEDAAGGPAALAAEQARFEATQLDAGKLQKELTKQLNLESVETCQKLFRVNAAARSQKIDVQLDAGVPATSGPAFERHPGGSAAVRHELNLSHDDSTAFDDSIDAITGPAPPSAALLAKYVTPHEQRQTSRSLKTYGEFMALKAYYGDVPAMLKQLDDYLAVKELFEESSFETSGNKKERQDYPWVKSHEVLRYMREYEERLKPPEPRTEAQQKRILEQFKWNKEPSRRRMPWVKQYADR